MVYVSTVLTIPLNGRDQPRHLRVRPVVQGVGEQQGLNPLCSGIFLKLKIHFKSNFHFNVMLTKCMYCVCSVYVNYIDFY